MEQNIEIESKTAKEESLIPYYCVCEESINPAFDIDNEDDDGFIQQVTPFEVGTLFEQKRAALKFISTRLAKVYGRDCDENNGQSDEKFFPDFDTYTIKGYLVTKNGSFPMFYWSNDDSCTFKPWWLADDFVREAEYLQKYYEPTSQGSFS